MDNDGFGVPEAVTVNELEFPAENVVLFDLVNDGATPPELLADTLQHTPSDREPRNARVGNPLLRI